MLGYEGDPDYAERSAVRLNRARELLEGTPDGTVDAALLRKFLSDHEHAPDSICRHETPGRSSFTCFWCIADLTDGTVSFGRGNPCESLTQTYAFAVWPAAQTATS
jgi:isopenicillin-N N-acyltransferase-like protein